MAVPRNRAGIHRASFAPRSPTPSRSPPWGRSRPVGRRPSPGKSRRLQSDSPVLHPKPACAQTVTSGPAQVKPERRASRVILRVRMTSFRNSAIELLQQASSARGTEYEALVTQAVAEYEALLGRPPADGLVGSSVLGELAEKRSPREAMWLRRKGLEWIARFPVSEQFYAVEACQIAEACAHLARFRTGSEADALFTQADEALARIVPDRLRAHLIDLRAGIGSATGPTRSGIPHRTRFSSVPG